MTGRKTIVIDNEPYFIWYWAEYREIADANRVTRRLQTYNIRSRITSENNGYTIWANENDCLKAMGCLK